MVKNTIERINYQIEESRAVWKAVTPFIRREKEEGRDVMIEGVAILPELVSQLEDVTYRVVFIGNQGSKHRENIQKSAKENAHDWIQNASDEYIAAFATFVVEMSNYIEKEARKYNYEYVEMSNSPFNDVVEKVVGSLLQR